MNDLLTELTALQQADSFFPSGAVSFSNGIETLREEGWLSDADEVRGFVLDQLNHRWATMERGVLAAAWRAAGDLEALRVADAVQDALSLPREQREGSRRAGAALLSTHARLDTAGAGEYAKRVAGQRAPGHLCAVQGLVWQAAGLSLTQSALVSAHTLCVGLLGAALRLGIIGHVAAQQILSATHPVIAGIVSSCPPGLDELHAYQPLADIAVMRHETQAVRLFAN